MKILYVTEAMGGGVFTYIVEMANILCKECEVYIAYIQDHKPLLTIKSILIRTFI